MPLGSKVVSFLFSPSSSQSSLFRQTGDPCWLIFQHMVTACSCTCKISFLKKSNLCPSGMPSKGLCQPGSWTGQTPCSLEVRHGSSADSPPYFPKNWKLSLHDHSAQDVLWPSCHPTILLCSQTTGPAGAFPSFPPHHLCQGSLSRNLPDCFCPDVLYFQQKT